MLLSDWEYVDFSRQIGCGSNNSNRRRHSEININLGTDVFHSTSSQEVMDTNFKFPNKEKS